MKLFKRVWTWVSHLGTAVWLWQVLPSAIFAMLTSVLAIASGWDPPLIVLAALFAFALVLVIATHAPKLASLLGRTRYPAQHSAVLQKLADELAELKGLAYSPGSWSRVNPLEWQAAHANSYSVTKRRAETLVEQISYDGDTCFTCRDFIHLCDMIVYDLLHREDARTNLRDLDSLGGQLFRYLHAGRPVQRSKLSLPEWIKEHDAEQEKRRLGERSLRRPA